MLCEKCNTNQATVHVQQIINGEKTDSYLCQNCASETDTGLSFGDLFQGLMDAFFKTAAQMPSGAAAEEIKVKCPICGFTYKDFKKTGKLGCGGCYTAFRKELDQVLKNIHGSNTHEGKYPHKFGAVLMQKKTLQNLKLSLKKAVEDEEYETAAQLRDQIKALEGGA